MNFKLSTLFWVVTLAAVVVGCWIWIQNEREVMEKEIAESQSQMAAMEDDINQFVRREVATSHFFKRQLGVINNSETLNRSHIKLVRMPDALGGKQSFGLPFTWQWRLLLMNPNEFELCWAIHDIPSGTSFDIPDEFIHRSHLNIADGHSPIGSGFGAEPSDAFLGDQPLEVIVYLRIDGDNEGGTLHVNYEICQPGEIRSFGETIWRGVQVSLKKDEIQWLRNSRSSRGGYGSIPGVGIEHNYQHVPLLDQPFSLEEPLSLIKIRSAKKVSPIKYEPYPGPCLGLQVWIQKKSGPTTDQPKRIWYRAPKANLDDASNLDQDPGR